MAEQDSAEHGRGYTPTTTHAEWGAGDPRLLVSRDDADRFVHHLTTDVVTIGSGDDCTLALAGAAALHATITHDDRDEYVLTMHGAGRMNASSPPGEHGERVETLRTGARFTIGDWTLVFSREEFADHGRPYGGREGGEGGRQNRQPERPDYPATGAVPTQGG
ncbi:hypothetical protein ACFPJ2_04175 [Microbacterium suwonense]|uniref:hypothetical protein n=1 Tax=Microbacterium suwonense TaxID=683047 RepID=UPI00360B56EA